MPFFSILTGILGDVGREWSGNGGEEEVEERALLADEAFKCTDQRRLPEQNPDVNERKERDDANACAVHTNCLRTHDADRWHSLDASVTYEENGIEGVL